MVKPGCFACYLPPDGASHVAPFPELPQLSRVWAHPLRTSGVVIWILEAGFDKLFATQLTIMKTTNYLTKYIFRVSLRSTYLK